MPDWFVAAWSNPRFYTLAIALVLAGFGVYDGVLLPRDGILAAIGALAAFFTASSIVNHGESTVKAAMVRAHEVRTTPPPALVDGHTLTPRG